MRAHVIRIENSQETVVKDREDRNKERLRRKSSKNKTRKRRRWRK
jgi:hypothetical protein